MPSPKCSPKISRKLGTTSISVWISAPRPCRNVRRGRPLSQGHGTDELRVRQGGNSLQQRRLPQVQYVRRSGGVRAHPVSGHRIDDHFMIGVPFARAINPISKTNWEGTGVEPDVKVPADEALATAQKLAMEKLGSK